MVVWGPSVYGPEVAKVFRSSLCGVVSQDQDPGRARPLPLPSKQRQKHKAEAETEAEAAAETRPDQTPRANRTILRSAETAAVSVAVGTSRRPRAKGDVSKARQYGLYPLYGRIVTA